jgi:hypothetical protein
MYIRTLICLLYGVSDYSCLISIVVEDFLTKPVVTVKKFCCNNCSIDTEICKGVVSREESIFRTCKVKSVPSENALLVFSVKLLTPSDNARKVFFYVIEPFLNFYHTVPLLYKITFENLSRNPLFIALWHVYVFGFHLQ